MDDFEKLKAAGQVFIDVAIPMMQTPGKFGETPLEQSQIRQKFEDTIDYVPYIIDDTVDQSQDSSESVEYVHNLGRVPRRAIAVAAPENHGDAAGWTGWSIGFWQSSDVQTYQGCLANQNANNVKSGNLMFATDDSERGFKGSITAADEDKITVLREWITVDDPVRDCRFFIVVFP